VIEGELRGRTLEADNVEIGVSGRVKADIRAQRVAIAEGGSLNGHVEMEGPAESPAPVVFKEKRASRDGGPPASGRS
jgi:cytoskeletal protein CcmA (bactofilin family)